MNIPNWIILDLLKQIVKDVEHGNKIGSTDHYFHERIMAGIRIRERMNDQINDIVKTLVHQSKRLDGLAEDVKAVEEKLSGRINATNKRLDGQGKDIKDHETRIKTLGLCLDRITDRFLRCDHTEEEVHELREALKAQKCEAEKKDHWTRCSSPDKIEYTWITPFISYYVRKLAGDTTWTLAWGITGTVLHNHEMDSSLRYDRALDAKAVAEEDYRQRGRTIE